MRPSGKSLSPYNKICIRNSFERLVCPSGRNKAETPARRSLRGTSKEEQQKVLRILSAIVGRAHWVDSISEIVFEFVKIQFTETNPKLGKIR